MASRSRLSFGSPLGRAIAIGVVAVPIVAFTAIALGVTLAYRDTIAFMGNSVIRQTVNAARIPDAERAELIDELRVVTRTYAENGLAPADFAAFMDSIETHPLLAAGELLLVAEWHPDGAHATQLRRVAQGIADGAIEPAEVDAILEPVSFEEPDGDRGLLEAGDVTADMLAAVAALARERADAAGLPDAPGTLDLSDRMRAEVEALLNNAEGPR
ncbi:MAG: hypothetical protein AAGI17_11430 [Planctomycetota bacterium]